MAQSDRGKVAPNKTREDSISHTDGQAKAIPLCFFFFFKSLPIHSSKCCESKSSGELEEKDPRTLLRKLWEGLLEMEL